MSDAPARTLFDEAKIAQRRAGDPRRSVWVSANAGSGKTRVLVDRVARLLLAGARPGTILCLTFTKAAAAEMRARLARRLGAWASMPDPALRDDLHDLAGADLAIEPAMLARARRLFAETLDAPGGMRVQTIHSFCESLLKRFPVEARLGASFAIADDGDTAELLAIARDRLLASAAHDGVVAEALAHVVAQLEPRALGEMLDSVAGDRRRLRRLIGADGAGVETAVAALRVALGIAEGATPESLLGEFVATMPAADLRRACRALAAGSDSDVERGQEIQCLLDETVSAERIERWYDVFLTTTDRAARKRLATAKAAKVDAEVGAILEREAVRCLGHLERSRALALHRGSAAVLRLGSRLVRLYDEAKRARGLLDYDDLIFRSLDLLEDVDAAWVRFKLDGGIDHVLVDEAQDTSREQWRLVQALTGEFFAGEGARGETVRTLFAVGDEKQSIFSFQGADPRNFAEARAGFSGLDASAVFDVVELAFSFRSTPTVLKAVDTLFAQEIARAGVAAEPTLHRAVRGGEPGLVELWPLVRPPERGEETAWDAPLDYVSQTSPPAELARRIAATIAGWLRGGERLHAGGRPIRAGDVMILVRRRNAFFTEMVRALKAQDVPVAGADRLVLASHIAVQDLVALGDFVELPRDDYTLACVLKSPLCGLTDDDLIALCPGRTRGLWSALRARAGEEARWAAAVADLSRWLAAADFSPPFEFYARVLGADGGRRRFLERLGGEALDPLDEFLALALAFEREHAPSLQGFLHWFRRGGAEIKRDMEQTRDEVRVMTVHAAKGLEAPVVFLPDTTAEPGAQNDPRLFWVDDARREARLLLWPWRKADDPELGRAARARDMAQRLEEYRRLLYVAATRARDRLYVCGWAGRQAPKDTAWHRLVEAGLRQDPDIREIDLPWPGETGLRLAAAVDAHHPPVESPPAAGAASAALPAWARLTAPEEPRPPRPLAPSSVEGDLAPGARVSGSTAPAARRGRALHRLFELLPGVPPDRRAEAGRRLLAHALPELDAPALAQGVAEVLAVMDAMPDLFGEGSRAEVAVAGLVGAIPVSGQIDRLIVGAGEVLLLDFKSARLPPASPADVPRGYVAQLALYRAVLQPIYPGRVVRAFLLWTAGPSLREVPGDLLDAALTRLQSAVKSGG